MLDRELDGAHAVRIRGHSRQRVVQHVPAYRFARIFRSEGRSRRERVLASPLIEQAEGSEASGLGVGGTQIAVHEFPCRAVVVRILERLGVRIEVGGPDVPAPQNLARCVLNGDHCVACGGCRKENPLAFGVSVQVRNQFPVVFPQ